MSRNAMTRVTRKSIAPVSVEGGTQPASERESDCIEALMQNSDIPLSSMVVRHIFILNSVLQRAGNRMTEAHDLTLPQWMALGCVGHKGDEGVTHSELGQRLMLSKAPITGVVDRLERAGYVKRKTSAHDRRVSCITITPEGRQKWSDVRQVMRTHADSSCSALSSDEQQILVALLQRVLETVVAGDPMLAGPMNPLLCAKQSNKRY
jgi:MarR family 2-MHQ and catechol resistance regulon transcriptional repressor